jgi:hypothetical protein
MSILNEIEARLNLGPKYVVIDHLKLTPDVVANHPVLIIDDSIHSGKTLVDLLNDIRSMGGRPVAVATLLGLQDGLDEVEKVLGAGKPVATLVVPSDEAFSFFFIRNEVPVLERLRRGALAHRQGVTLVVTHPDLPAEEAAFRLLTTIGSCGGVSHVRNSPPVNPEDPSPIFHGTAFLSQATLLEITRTFPTEAGIAAQEKLRVFISRPAPSIEAHLCPIRYFTNDDNGEVHADLAKLEDQMSDQIAGQVTKEVSELLRTQGFGVEEA